MKRPELLRQNEKLKSELQVACLAKAFLLQEFPLIDDCVDAIFDLLEKVYDPREGKIVGFAAGLIWDGVGPVSGDQMADLLVTLLVPN